MSRETLATLNNSTLIGFTEKRGRAWHYRADEQGEEPNHYPGAIPVADVRRRLFNWTAEHSPKKYDVTATAENATGIDEHGRPVRTITSTDKVVWRSDRPEVDLGTFGPDYTPRQYQDVLLDGLAHIITPDGLAVTADSLAIGTAGVLRNGGRAWVQVETPDTVTTPEGVNFRPFLMAASSHDGSLSVTYSAGSTLVVCDNTMAIALDEAHHSGHIFKIKHTPKAPSNSKTPAKPSASSSNPPTNSPPTSPPCAPPPSPNRNSTGSSTRCTRCATTSAPPGNPTTAPHATCCAPSTPKTRA
jgi:phage/plasmid-like protein (TIGR03299 family)